MLLFCHRLCVVDSVPGGTSYFSVNLMVSEVGRRIHVEMVDFWPVLSPSGSYYPICTSEPRLGSKGSNRRFLDMNGIQRFR